MRTDRKPPRALLRAIWTAATLPVLFAAAPRAAAAHDQGVLKLASKTFRAGDSLAVTGAKFTPKDEVTLALVGVAGRIALGDIPTDSAGAFRRVVLVPPTAAAGQYRLIAEAIDGDEVAALEVMVLASTAAAAMPAMPGMEGMPGHEGMAHEPTGEPLALTRSRSTAVTLTAAVFIIACGIGGVLLLRSVHSNPTGDVS